MPNTGADWVRFNAQSEAAAIDIQTYERLSSGSKSWGYDTWGKDDDQNEAAQAVADAMRQLPLWMQDIFVIAAELLEGE